MIENGKYLIALSSSPNSKGFCHQTVLVSAVDKQEAINIAMRLKPNKKIGEIKEVFY